MALGGWVTRAPPPGQLGGRAEDPQSVVTIFNPTNPFTNTGCSLGDTRELVFQVEMYDIDGVCFAYDVTCPQQCVADGGWSHHWATTGQCTAALNTGATKECQMR